MSKGKPVPDLGPERGTSRSCCAKVDMPDWRFCGQPAVVHVLWTPDLANHSYICAEHQQKALGKFGWHRWHVLNSDCGMPGSTLFPGGEACCYEGSDLPAVEVRKELGVS